MCNDVFETTASSQSQLTTQINVKISQEKAPRIHKKKAGSDEMFVYTDGFLKTSSCLQ